MGRRNTCLKFTCRSFKPQGLSRQLNLCSAMPACRYRSGSIWQPFFELGVWLVLAARLFRQVSQYAVTSWESSLAARRW